MKVLADFCAVYIDDFRLSDLAEYDSPLYSYRMWGYLYAAIPFFDRPFEEQERLLGTSENPKLILPKFATVTYTVPAEETQDFEIALGDEYAGYELSSCHRRQIDKSGNVFLSPTDYTYHAESGTVTVKATAQNPMPAGAILDFNFYTDGYFQADLTLSEMKILGLCFSLVWETRFDQDYLSRVSKVEDKSFFEQNRANKQNADTERYRAVLETLRQEMQTFETRQHYNAAVLKKLPL